MAHIIHCQKLLASFCVPITLSMFPFPEPKSNHLINLLESFPGLKSHSALRIIVCFFFSKIIFQSYSEKSLIFQSPPSFPSESLPLEIWRTGTILNVLPSPALFTVPGSFSLHWFALLCWNKVSMSHDSCTLVTSHSSILAVSD